MGSVGLGALADALVGAGYELIVVAPSEDRSGSSASLGRIVPKSCKFVQPTTLRGVSSVIEAATMDAPPGLIAMAAVLGAFGDPPEIVVSGVNLGPNTGHSILHSGTVGAILTAQNFGASGLAVSLAEGERWWTETACALATSVLSELTALPPRTALNLNIPALPMEDLRDLRWAELDAFGSVRAAVASAIAGVQFEFTATGAELDPASDTALLAGGHPTLTALCAASRPPISTSRQADPTWSALELHVRPSTRYRVGVTLCGSGTLVRPDVAEQRLAARFGDVSRLTCRLDDKRLRCSRRGH